jgi:uncharacterized protein YndB with AHSA1/START domain
VWRAITESGQLEQWFPSKVLVDELRPGGEMTFAFEEDMPLDAPSTMTGVSEDWRGLYEAYQGRGVPSGAPIPGE